MLQLTCLDAGHLNHLCFLEFQGRHTYIGDSRGNPGNKSVASVIDFCSQRKTPCQILWNKILIIKKCRKGCVFNTGVQEFKAGVGTSKCLASDSS